VSGAHVSRTQQLGLLLALAAFIVWLVLRTR